MRALLTHPITFKIVIGLYVACITTLLASYFAVSTMDVPVSMYLQAPKKFAPGAKTASRGIILDAPTGRMFVGAETRFSIDGEEVATGETQSHGHMHVQLETPPSEGEQSLHIAVEHPDIEDFELDVPVTIENVKQFEFRAEATTRQTDEKKAKEEEWEGELKVTRLPINGEVPRGLPSTVLLLLQDAETGAGVRGTIFVEKIEGMLEGEAPVELETDEFGVVRIPLTAVTSQKWTLNASASNPNGGEERTGKGTLWLYSVAAQFSLVPKQLIAHPGQPIQAFVHTLHRSGGIMVDLYDGDRWAYADAFGIAPQGAGVIAVVPDAASELVRMQVYQDLFEPASAWDSRWFPVTDKAGPEGCMAGLRVVLNLHTENGGPLQDWAKDVGSRLGDSYRRGCERWLEAALAGIPVRFEPAPLLVNTQKADRQELDEWRKEVQEQLMLATASVLFIGFLFVLLLVLRGMQRAQKHAELIREVELETATDEELAMAPKLDVERWLVVLQTVIMVVTIFTFGASLVMLLRLM